MVEKQGGWLKISARWFCEKSEINKNYYALFDNGFKN